MTRIGLAALLVVAGVLPLTAQSNQFVDLLLDTPQVTLGQAAYLLLTARGILSEEATPGQAAEALPGRGWRIPSGQAAEPLRLGEYCFLIMQAYRIKGGLMYRIAPGPRYAARELAYRKLVRGKAYPDRGLSGEEALGILRGLLEQLAQPEQPAREGGNP